LNNGQKRLKKAFEKTKSTIPPPIFEQDDISMIENDEAVVADDTNENNEQKLPVVVNEVIFNTIMQKNVRN
jgi:hypothetical protein